MKAKWRWSRTLANEASTSAVRSPMPTRPLMLDPHKYGMMRISQPSEEDWDGAGWPDTLGVHNRQITSASTTTCFFTTRLPYREFKSEPEGGNTRSSTARWGFCFI